LAGGIQVGFDADTTTAIAENNKTASIGARDANERRG
jgi:hypothetical protein